jgi:hypothetical protein
MYAAWHAALVSAIAIAAALAVGVAIQLVRSPMPDPLPVAFVVGSFAIAALVAGVFVAFAVRGGLFLARCRRLPGRLVLIIAAVNVTVLGILGTLPVETYAIRLDMPSAQSSHVQVPTTMWLTIVLAILLPVAVAYFVGRAARSRANAA